MMKNHGLFSQDGKLLKKLCYGSSELQHCYFNHAMVLPLKFRNAQESFSTGLVSTN